MLILEFFASQSFKQIFFQSIYWIFIAKRERRIALFLFEHVIEPINVSILQQFITNASSFLASLPKNKQLLFTFKTVVPFDILCILTLLLYAFLDGLLLWKQNPKWLFSLGLISMVVGGPKIKLPTGAEMPAIGLGTWLVIEFFFCLFCW